MVTARISLLLWFSIFLFLVGACAPAAGPTPERPMSQIALATSSLMPSPTAIPLPYPSYQSPTPSITPSITPVGYPPPTELPLPTFPPPPTKTPTLTPTITRTPPPTIDPTALSPADAAALLPWTELATEPGHGLYQVSRSPYGVEGLEWSPDGRYLWIQVATSEYLLMGGQPTTVALIASPWLYPVSESPDGNYLAFDDPINKKVVFDLRSETVVTLDRGGYIVWSPATSRFVLWTPYSSASGAPPIDLVDATDGRLRQLVAHGLWPAWSPDGRQVAYWQPEAGGYSLWLVSVDDGEEIRLTLPVGQNPRNLLGGPLVPFNYDSTPQWSSDGRYVAFIALRDGLPEAHVVDLAPGG